MIEMRWDLAKSRKLKDERGVSFEDILQAELVAVLKHPGKPHQNILLFKYQNYIWVAPCLKKGNEIFLKTLFPSRKYTKIWKRGGLQ